MAYREFCKEKLGQYKIEGQMRPFIDETLQLRLPGLEGQKNSFYPYTSSIYSHYSNSFSPTLTVPSEIELEKAMHEAQQSYESWKQMQSRLTNIVKSISKQKFN